MAKAIGIDLGGNNIKGVLLNTAGEIIHQTVCATAPRLTEIENDQQWKTTVSQMVLELKSKSAHSVDALGLAAPGLPNHTNSAIRVMPGRLNGLENLNWADYLDEKEVWVLNDAHAALIAEAKFGVGKGIKNLVLLTLGTGVGGGIMINGKLYQGNDQKAGHVGHMTLDTNNENPGITGMPGTLENAIGDATVATRSYNRFQSTTSLVEAFRQRDNFATYVWLDSVRKLALGLCSLDNLFSPDLIILGGGITKAGEALYQPLADFMEIYEWKNVGKRTPVLPAHFCDMAGAVGAAGFALSRIGTNQFE